MKKSIYLCIGFLTVGCSSYDNEPAEELSSVPQRIVVVGDIHADVEAAREAFQLAGATDQQDNWIGGELVLVQLGDLIGRSYQERQVLDFVFDVREQAKAVGGEVHVVLGNHEVFGARLERRWVHQDAYAGFDSIPGLEVDHPRLADIPDNQRARSAALMPGGLYAKRLAEFPAVLKIGDTVFAHGGVTPHWANYGIDKINDQISAWLRAETDEPVSAQGMDPRNVDDSVMQSRHFSEKVDDESCALLDESLTILGANRMVVAHTVQHDIASYCDGRVWAIDVGMSRSYSSRRQVLEIKGDTITAISSPSDIWLFENMGSKVQPVGRITNLPGYDNQPSFTPDSRTVLFTSDRTDSVDTYAYDIESGEITRVTFTEEMEYSPLTIPGDLNNRFSVVRQDSGGAQELWAYSLDGSVDPQQLVRADSVAYYTWAGNDQILFWRLGSPRTLRVIDTDSSEMTSLAEGFIPSLQPIPGENASAYYIENPDGSTEIRRFDWDSWETEHIVEPYRQERDFTFSADGSILMLSGGKLLRFRPGTSVEWELVAEFGIKGGTRLAVSPNQRYLAAVAVR